MNTAARFCPWIEIKLALFALNAELGHPYFLMFVYSYKQHESVGQQLASFRATRGDTSPIALHPCLVPTATKGDICDSMFSAKHLRAIH